MILFNTLKQWEKKDIDITSAYFTSHLITYLGNKRSLLSFLKENIDKARHILGKDRITSLDGFSGSGVVSRLLREYSTTLYTNDLEPYVKTINECYLSRLSEIDFSEISKQIKILNRNKFNSTVYSEGIIQKFYAPKNDKNIQRGERVFYTINNAKIIDNIRQQIEKYSLKLKPYLLAPLLIEASIHVNTSGVFKGFYKNKKGIGQFGGEGKNALRRICQEIELEVPIFSDTPCEVKIYNEDINDLIKLLPHVDLAYYDPPYNQHPYGSNYFMLNVINDYKEPAIISKVSGIPVNWNRSAYNKRGNAEIAMESLIKNTKANIIFISYNNEGIIPALDFSKLLKQFGTVELAFKEYNTFRASRNLRFRPLKTKEYLWILHKGMFYKNEVHLQESLQKAQIL
ncbi:MAG TPA: DNA adenine methylase [Bacteroidales bacterium]|jgi:adenine-specific DNA-methyltransferase|nr:DNA adenine methylase [Bacteroidales bacterium]